MKLRERWLQSCQQLAIPIHETSFELIVDHYAEPHRHYHTLQHLTECFNYFDLVKSRANNVVALEMAIWFHDIIYDVKAHNNEILSAQLAIDFLAPYQVPKATLTTIYQLILATTHQQPANMVDEQIIVDVDLAILGASPLRFAEYERQIRAEYSRVPYFLYKTKRKQLLTAFLARHPLYYTPELADLLAKQAEINLTLASC